MFERLRKRDFRRLCPRHTRSAPLATRQGQSPHGRSRFNPLPARPELGMPAGLGYGLWRTVEKVESEAWAKMAVHHLEELEAEGMALERGDACAMDGDQGSRLAAIAADVDRIYARLDHRAEQVAAHAGVAAKASLPLPPPPPPLRRSKSSARSTREQTLRGIVRPSSPEEVPSREKSPGEAATAQDALPEPPSLALDSTGDLSKGRVETPLSVIEQASVRDIPLAGTSPEQPASELAAFALELDNMDSNNDVLEVATVNIDTVVVQHPQEESTEIKKTPAEEEDEWLCDDRLELKETLAAMRQDREKSSQAFNEATRALVGQTQALDRLASQAEAAQAALERFQLAKDSVEAQVAAAREAVQLQRAQERQASLALAAMEARVRSESNLLQGLDRIQARIRSVESALESARGSAEQEKSLLSRDVEASLLAAEKATRQAEEMRDAAERAHQRAQQAIAHAQEVEAKSDRREQELRRVVDGLESQISGLRHEEDGVNQQLAEIRSAKAQAEVARKPRRSVAPQLPEDAGLSAESLNPPN